MKKTMIAMICVIALVAATVFPPIGGATKNLQTAYAADDTSILDEGNCGAPEGEEVDYEATPTDSVRWKLDDCGTLTISGVGEMYNYGYDTPWVGYSQSIKTVVVETGVTSLSDWSFDGCSELTDVTLPKGLESIGKLAFSSCSKLTSIVLPEGLVSIGDDAFSNSGLMSIEIPSSVTYIGTDAFSMCNMTSIEFPEGLTCGDNATFTIKGDVLTISGTGDVDRAPWGGLSFINRAVIEDGITNVPRYAFSNMYGLTEVSIPSSVTRIDSYAFRECTALEKLVLPDGITYIGDRAFEGCNNLTIENFPETMVDDVETDITITCIDGSVKISGKGPVEYAPFASLSFVNSVVIEDGVTNVPGNGFSGCPNLTTVSVASTVEKIDLAAFMECPKLSSVTLQEGVQTIETWAFLRCTALTEIEIPSSVTSIGDEAFYECSGLQTITIKNKDVIFGSGVFTGTGVTICGYAGSTAETYASDNHLRFKDIESGNVTENDVLAAGKYDSGVTWAVHQNGDLIFSGEGSVPDYDDASQPWNEYMSQITRVVVEDGVTAIGKGAFNGMTGVKALVMNNKNLQIDTDAWTDDTFLCPYIYGYADSTAEKLAPKLASKGWTVTFTNIDTNKNTSYGVCGGDLTWNLTDEGVLTISGTGRMEDYVSTVFDDELGKEVEYVVTAPWSDADTTVNKVVISEGVEYIGAYAFSGLPSDKNNITSVVIASTVESIGDSAFSDCDALTAVTIPAGVKSIGDCAFYHCDNLAAVTLSKGVTSIGDSAFCACKLTTVAIPDTVTSIGGYVFGANANLTTATIPASVTTIGDQIFVDCSSSLNVTVEAGSVAETYMKDNGYTYTAVSSGNTGNDKKDDTKDDTSSNTKKDDTKTDNTKTDNTSGNTKQDTANKNPLAKVTVTAKATNTASGVKLTWNKVSAASGYYVYRKLSGGSWVKIAAISKTATVSYTDKKASAGKTYSYKVEAYKGNSVSVVKSAAIVRVKTPTTVKAVNTTSGVKVTWAKTAGAKGYVVYRKTGSGAWKKIYTATKKTKTSYVDKKASSGKVYTYKVVAKNGNYLGAAKAAKAVRYLKAPTVKVARKSSGVKVTWTKAAGAKGYIVYRKTGSGKWVKVKTVKSAKTVTYLDKKTKKGKKYAYRVKAYYGKTYSAVKTSKTVKR